MLNALSLDVQLVIYIIARNITQVRGGDIS